MDGLVCPKTVAWSQNPGTKKQHMDGANPAFIIRNYMAHEAILLAEKEIIVAFSIFGIDEKTIRMLTCYWCMDDQKSGWAFEKPGCSMLSCSS